MSIDRFEFLSSYVDDNVAGYYTKISEFATLAPASGLGQPLNAFAVKSVFAYYLTILKTNMYLTSV